MPRNVVYLENPICFQFRLVRQYDLILAREDQVKRAVEGKVLRIHNNPLHDRWIRGVTPVTREDAVEVLSLRGAFIAPEKLDQLVAAGSRSTLVILWLEQIESKS